MPNRVNGLHGYNSPTSVSYTHLSKEYLGTEGSYYIAATAENNSDNTLWKLEKVEGTGYPDLEPLEPFEPVENKVDDVQTMLEEGLSLIHIFYPPCFPLL